MMTSHILKYVDLTKTQKSRHLENKNIIFSSNKKDSLITHQGLLYGKDSFVAEVTFKEILGGFKLNVILVSFL